VREGVQARKTEIRSVVRKPLFGYTGGPEFAWLSTHADRFQSHPLKGGVFRHFSSAWYRLYPF
jgi:hypothetical protein